jgi:two-component system, OmpR family, response regulator CpxR
MDASRLVLIIEDNEDFQNLFGMVAEEAGYRTEMVYNGAEALARLEREPIPAVVLLDSRLPGAGGAEILQAARARPDWAHVRIFIMTADVRGAQEFRSLPSGQPHADGVFEKGGATIHELRDLFKRLRVDTA